jgi:hypothetical protein
VPQFWILDYEEKREIMEMGTSAGGESLNTSFNPKSKNLDTI